jgi:hypothetical protein
VDVQVDVQVDSRPSRTVAESATAFAQPWRSDPVQCYRVTSSTVAQADSIRALARK